MLYYSGTPYERHVVSSFHITAKYNLNGKSRRRRSIGANRAIFKTLITHQFVNNPYSAPILLATIKPHTQDDGGVTATAASGVLAAFYQ